ncbi:MAG: aldo/keto reductase [Chthonomonadales bacterium]
MITRQLAGTHMTTSILSYGASPLGGGYGPIDDSESIRSVHAALDLGINFFDTSPLYGETKSETVLGQALKGVDRDRYYLCSKVGRYTETHFDFRPEVVKASVEASLKRLGVEYLDLLLCHDIEYVDVDQALGWAIPVLEKLKQEGKIRAIGVSGYPTKIYDMALDRTKLDAVLVYAHYNLFDTTLLNLLSRLERENVGLIAASPMGMGLLTGSELPAWHPAPSDIRGACLKAFDFCKSRGKDLPTLALQFALANERISTTLVGMPTVAQVEKNVQTAAEPLDEELLVEVLRILEPIRDRPWSTGLPENN